LIVMIRYCLTVLQRNNSLDTRNINQAGFALPVAIGMSLVMIIVAASMIGRAQSDRVITNSQRETSRALSASEAGIIRVQSFLDHHKILATKNLDKWSNTLDSLSPVQANCRLINLTATKQQAELFKNNNWINLDNSNQNKGRYKIVDYKYRDGVGKLTIAGEIDAYNTTQNSAKSTLTVEIPIGNESANIAPPALWANTFNLNPNQKITGQVQAAACPQLPITDPDGIVGVDLSNISLVSGVPSGQIIADPFTLIPVSKTAPATATPLPAITTSIQLPRLSSIDTPDANGEYHYLVDVDDATSGHSIKLKDLDLIKIDVTATQKVNLYLKGNIDLAGSQTLNVNPTHPNLRIYGSSQTLKFSIKDNASITAFIHAPFADAKSISSTTPNPNKNITGGLWVNSWDSATSPTEIPIIQAGNWSDFGIAKLEQPAQISPISSWQRVGD
jgi:Tfp pilus assembly protein PilX